MMNQDNPYAMNQTCKVCGEPAAGFHFGAFTCEGCKSFFGRSYNNLSSISDCKNNGECIINKKNRTACKACRLRKCLMVGMSKSGSRYGRRSNWFKIHCLLQEQQQQAAAAMAAHHNNQQQQHQHQQQQVAAAAAAAAAAAQQQHPGQPGQKPPPPGVPPPANAAAALGMLGHAGSYPGLYPPRTKEELMMLGLEEYAKHPVASPSVSSPDSHNSDSSVEVNVRGNPLLHLGGGGKHGAAEAATGTPPQLRKDLPPFLPLHFPGLGSMPVMPPPAFLPPSHLLFPGYHPALYQHHQGLLKPSAEQQQAAAAAAAVQHLFNTTSSTQNRFTPKLIQQGAPLTTRHDNDERVAAPSPNGGAGCGAGAGGGGTKSEAQLINNNHIPNGSKAAEELTKRFYLDAVLKSQRSSPPPATTKLPPHGKHDHSISALVTPNSESGRERLKSRQSNDDDDAGDGDMDGEAASLGRQRHDVPAVEERHSNNGNDSDCGEDLVVSMTPPRSPAMIGRPNEATLADAASAAAVAAVVLLAQDNPIDLSMKTGSSVASSLSSKCSSSGSVLAADSENETEPETEAPAVNSGSGSASISGSVAEEHEELDVDDEDNSTVETVKTTIHHHSNHMTNTLISNNNNNNNNNNNSNANNNNNNINTNNNINHNCSDGEECEAKSDGIKRKLEVMTQPEAEASPSLETAIDEGAKRVKLDSTAGAVVERLVPLPPAKLTTTPLDLTTKV